MVRLSHPESSISLHLPVPLEGKYERWVADFSGTDIELQFASCLVCHTVTRDCTASFCLNKTLAKAYMCQQFLVSLGLSKSLTALVWIAGPLCGIVVQPIIGAFSDRSHNSWGRRRPFIVAGSVGVILSILCLAWVEEIVEALPSPSGLDSRDLKPLVIVLAVILVYFLNIAIQPVQMGMRALIAENTHHQHQANAWASYLTGIGNIVGYLSGFISLPKLFHLPSLTQFQCLGIVASVALFATVAISCFAIQERNPRSNARSSGLDFRRIPGKLLDTFRTMPPKIREVCQIQFVAWMGWFPFLYYATT